MRTAVAYNRQPVREPGGNGDDVSGGLRQVGDQTLSPGQKGSTRRLRPRLKLVPAAIATRLVADDGMLGWSEVYPQVNAAPPGFSPRLWIAPAEMAAMSVTGQGGGFEALETG